MKTWKVMLLGSTLSIVCTSGVMAQNLEDWSFETGISTLGGYFAPIYAYNDSLDVRVPIYFGSYSDDFEENGNTIDGKLDMFSGGIVADYAPWSNGFYLSGGLLLGGYDLSGSADEFDGDSGTTYVGTFDVDVEQKNDIAPVLSVGYRYKSAKGFTAGVELGGKLVNMEASISGAGYDALSTADKADVDAEIKSINDDFDDFPVIPFLTFSLGYAF